MFNMFRSSKGLQSAEVALPSIASQLWQHAMQQQPTKVRCGTQISTLLVLHTEHHYCMSRSSALTIEC